MKKDSDSNLNHEKVSGLPAAFHPAQAGEVVQIPLEKIIPNRFQPRKTIEKESLQELIDSISTHGVLQPIVVRRVYPERSERDPKKADTYEIMMGERRFRSCEQLKLQTIPAIITEANDQRMMECALVENTHRKDLNPIERAQAYQLLADTFHLTQEEVAKRVGADRTTVSHFIRLLGLPQEIQDDISRHPHLLGHAKAILALPDSTRRLALWQRVRNEDLSVRHLRIIIDAYMHPRGISVTPGSRAPQYREFHPGNDPELRKPYERLFKKMPPNAEVRITYGQIGAQFIFGSVSLSCHNKDDLLRILNIISGGGV